jgi:Mg2+ and Co2+ transporter CorA
MLEITFPNFTWISLSRSELSTNVEPVQCRLQALSNKDSSSGLLDLHVQDLLNDTLPSHFDYTADYDLLIFRRLTVGAAATSSRSALSTIQADTSPVAFVVMDKVVLSVHPEDCAVRDAFAKRLESTPQSRQPTSSAELMLRMVNQMVDAYLDLRRDLTKTLDYWQELLLSQSKRFSGWSALLEVRTRLRQLDDTCEDQRAAVQEWIDELDTWTTASSSAQALRENELLTVRSRDVLEHIERVAHHVRRLEETLETISQSKAIAPTTLCEP